MFRKKKKLKRIKCHLARFNLTKIQKEKGIHSLSNSEDKAGHTQ